MAGGDDANRARDPSRRAFFRTFSQQTVRNAGAVIGAAAELRRSSAEAARELFDLGGTVLRPEGTTQPPAAGQAAVGADGLPVAGKEIFRSPYRFTGEAIVILDQRELPDRVTTVACVEPSEIASAIRSGAITGGPVLAQVAAYGLVLAVGSAAGRPAQSRDQIFRAATSIIGAAQPGARSLAWAIERTQRRYEELVADGAEVPLIREALLHDADGIAADAAIAHSALGDHAAAAIAAARTSETDRPVHLLMHADMGPLSCGMVGMGTAAISALASSGRAIHVWLTEAAPSMEGARISALQLTQYDVPHTIVADAAVAWLLANRSIDAVLVRGDRVCANGDTGTLIGGHAVAHLAHAAGVPVLVCAPLASVDLAASDGSVLASNMRSPAEAPTGGSSRGRPSSSGGGSVAFGVRINPRTDAVPAALIDAVVTETGALGPPYADALLAAGREGAA
jgi:methylthioribose-1-phosphate isomerase